MLHEFIHCRKDKQNICLVQKCQSKSSPNKYLRSGKRSTRIAVSGSSCIAIVTDKPATKPDQTTCYFEVTIRQSADTSPSLRKNNHRTLTEDMLLNLYGYGGNWWTKRKGSTSRRQAHQASRRHTNPKGSFLPVSCKSLQALLALVDCFHQRDSDVY